MNLITPALANCADPPKTLFSKGHFDDRPRIAIVGSRKASREGTVTAYDLAVFLAQRGLTIVSGMAAGIDTAAHRGALSVGGATIAVLPCGIGTIYPMQNSGLARQILGRNGGLISEYPGKYRPKAYDFLRRNRIIAGLSEVVIIVEAGSRSGALNTAKHALEMGIDLMAVPGSIYSLLAAGTNNLIRQGAQPLTRFEDVLELLGFDSQQSEMVILTSDKDQTAVVNLLKTGPLAVDDLAGNLGLAINTVQSALTEMEISGLIIRLPGNVVSLRKT